MNNLELDYSLTDAFVSKNDIEEMKGKVEKAKKMLLDRACPGNDYTGWIDLTG